MDGFRSSSSYLKCSRYKSRGDAPVMASRDSLVTKKKYLGVRQCASGRWSAKIKFGKYCTIHLGTFETAEDAADAFARARMERELEKRNQNHDLKEAHKSLKNNEGMESKSCFESSCAVRFGNKEDDTEGASGLKECEFGSLVLAKTDSKAQLDCNFGMKSLELECVNNCNGVMVQNHSTDKAMDGFRSSSSSLNCSNSESQTDAPVTHGLDSLVMKKYVGVRQTRSGRWSAKIKFGKNSTHHLGTFETAEEAADAFARARMERDSKR